MMGTAHSFKMLYTSNTLYGVTSLKTNNIVRRTYSVCVEREPYTRMQTLLSPHSFPQNFLNANSTEIIYSLAYGNMHTNTYSC